MAVLKSISWNPAVSCVSIISSLAKSSSSYLYQQICISYLRVIFDYSQSRGMDSLQVEFKRLGINEGGEVLLERLDI
jgi:hypothetical protein